MTRPTRFRPLALVMTMTLGAACGTPVTDEPVQLLGTVSDGVLIVASNSSASGASSD